MNNLFLEDLKNLTEEEVKDHIKCNYKTIDVDRFDILIAYESVGSWGCDSASWFLLLEKETNKLYETHGSHCSCYGFEGQWEPEKTTKEYLLSENFYFICGGYDNSEGENKKAIISFLQSYFNKS